MPSVKPSAIRAHKPRRRRGDGRAPARDTWRYASRSAVATDQLGRLIGRSLQGGEVLALYGELGSGKTALVRGIATGLGASPRAVSSPTFVLIHEYDGRLRLAHADLYRLQSDAELEHIGLSEYDDGRTVTAIEWAEKAGPVLPADRLEVHLRHHSRHAREIIVTATGIRSQRLLVRIMTRHAAPDGKRRRERPR